MHPAVFAAVGAVAGFLVGFIVARSMAKKQEAAWKASLDETRQKLETAKRDSAAALEKEKARATEAEGKAKEKGDKLTAAEKSLEQLKGQVKQLQAAQQDLEASRGKAASAAEAHAAARQQAEGRVKQAEALAAQTQQALTAAQGQLQKTQSELAGAQDAADRRAKEVQKLRAEVAAAKQGGSSLDESVKAFANADGSLDTILKTLMDSEGQKAAVLADANGIIVAAVGETALKEGMAATSQLIGSIATQLVDMVPFSSVRSYYLQDTQQNVLAGRAFNCQGETIGLATYGSRIPSDRVLDGAMASLSAALE